MTRNLEGKVALVTGASRGIGRSIALALAGAGASVVISARNRERLESVKGEIAVRGGDSRGGGSPAGASEKAASPAPVLAVPADLADEKAIGRLFETVKKELGRLDVLVNNAGIGLWGKLADFPIAQFDTLMNVNVRGMYLCCQHALRFMIPARSGYIINVSSVVGFKGYPKQSAYTASKHAVMGLTKSLAVEAQEHNVHVAVILPGGVDTEFIGDARPDLDRSVLIPPDDIANTVLYLLSLSDRAWVDQVYVRRRTGTPFI